MEYKITKIIKYGKGIFTSEKIGTQYYNVVYVYLYRKEDKNKVDPIKVHFMHMFDETIFMIFLIMIQTKKKKNLQKKTLNNVEMS